MMGYPGGGGPSGSNPMRVDCGVAKSTSDMRGLRSASFASAPVSLVMPAGTPWAYPRAATRAYSDGMGSPADRGRLGAADELLRAAERLGQARALRAGEVDPAEQD